MQRPLGVEVDKQLSSSTSMSKSKAADTTNDGPHSTAPAQRPFSSSTPTIARSSCRALPPSHVQSVGLQLLGLSCTRLCMWCTVHTHLYFLVGLHSHRGKGTTQSVGQRIGRGPRRWWWCNLGGPQEEKPATGHGLSFSVHRREPTKHTRCRRHTRAAQDA